MINVCPGNDLTCQLRVDLGHLVVSELDSFTSPQEFLSNLHHSPPSVSGILSPNLPPIHLKVVISALGLTSLFDCNNFSKVKEHPLLTKLFL